MESLVDKIRNEILTLAVSDCRIREQDLAKKFEVSRTSVRDVLKQLQVEKLIDRTRNKGITLHRFSLKEIADIYDLRAVLEGFAGRLVTEKITKQMLMKLREVAEEYTKNENLDASAELRSELDDKFHRMIVDIADNDHLRDIMNQFSILKQAFSLYAKKEMPLKGINHTPYTHCKIVDAIEHGNGDLAEQLLRKHSLWAKQHLLARFTGVNVEEL
jgi:DNA-binding GntR family transcriptional regulator